MGCWKPCKSPFYHIWSFGRSWDLRSLILWTWVAELGHGSVQQNILSLVVATSWGLEKAYRIFTSIKKAIEASNIHPNLRVQFPRSVVFELSDLINCFQAVELSSLYTLFLMHFLTLTLIDTFDSVLLKHFETINNSSLMALQSFYFSF